MDQASCKADPGWRPGAAQAVPTALQRLQRSWPGGSGSRGCPGPRPSPVREMLRDKYVPDFQAARLGVGAQGHLVLVQDPKDPVPR